MAGFIKNQEHSPGSYKINTILINDIDVKWMMIEINIYEDLFSPVMTGDITIVDTHNLLANEPIIEGDIVNISLECNSDDKAQVSADGGNINAKFEIIKIMNRTKVKDNEQLYILKFSSSGWSNNVRTRISRSYIQKKYSDIVFDIFNSKFFNPISGLKENIQEKEINIEETEGIFNVIIPRWKPITCFNWLAGRSRKKFACNWLFWEDKESFNFKSFESLINEDSVAIYDVIIKNTENTGEKDYFAISNYEYMDTGEVLFYGLEGTWGNRLLIHDIMNKKIFDYFPSGIESDNYIIKPEYNYQDMFDDMNHVDINGKALVEEDVTSKFSEVPGNARLTVIQKHYKQWNETGDFEYDKWLRQRIAQKKLLKYLRIKVWAVGSFSRTVGQKITFNIPSPEANNSSEKNDPRLKGDYIITALRHKFDMDKHVIVMELMKDCINGDN